MRAQPLPSSMMMPAVHTLKHYVKAQLARAHISVRTHLQVHLGVPVAVKQHHHVSSVQVDPQAPRARGQQENEFLASGAVEVLDLALPVLSAGVACSWAC